jgi:hypothetical protein
MALPVEIIHKPGLPIVHWIARNMREWDRREIFALRWDDDPRGVAESACQSGDTSWAALVDGIPAVAWGALPMWPGVWSMWAFGTDNFPHACLKVTRMIRRVIIPALVSAGARRAQAYSMAGHDDAQRWLESWGAKRESTAPGFGRGGEDFYLYVRTP